MRSLLLSRNLVSREIDGEAFRRDRLRGHDSRARERQVVSTPFWSDATEIAGGIDAYVAAVRVSCALTANSFSRARARVYILYTRV